MVVVGEDADAELTTVGTTLDRLNAAATSLANTRTQTAATLSTTQDADMATVLVTLANEQSVYKAALQSGASVIQQSLLDFLR